MEPLSVNAGGSVFFMTAGGFFTARDIFLSGDGVFFCFDEVVDFTAAAPGFFFSSGVAFFRDEDAADLPEPDDAGFFAGAASVFFRGEAAFAGFFFKDPDEDLSGSIFCFCFLLSFTVFSCDEIHPGGLPVKKFYEY